MPAQEWRIELSYDADTDFYTHGHDMRISLIKFLLKNQAYRLRAYVGSTISFSCMLEAENVYKYWQELISDEFGGDFYYILSIIHRTNPASVEYAIVKKIKPGFDTNFNNDVLRAKVELKAANIPYLDL